MSRRDRQGAYDIFVCETRGCEVLFGWVVAHCTNAGRACAPPPSPSALMAYYVCVLTFGLLQNWVGEPAAREYSVRQTDSQTVKECEWSSFDKYCTSTCTRYPHSQYEKARTRTTSSAHHSATRCKPPPPYSAHPRKVATHRFCL